MEEGNEGECISYNDVFQTPTQHPLQGGEKLVPFFPAGEGLEGRGKGRGDTYVWTDPELTQNSSGLNFVSPLICRFFFNI